MAVLAFQLLPIVYDINSTFDSDLAQDVRGIVLDIPKAFNKVWHEGLLFKLKAFGVKGELLIFFVFSSRAQPKSPFQWLDLFFGVDKIWSATGICSSPSFVFNIH